MERPIPRLTSIMGVARAMMATLGPAQAVEVLVIEFGWDATFQALALLRGEDAAVAFGAAWEHLLTDPIERQLRDVHWRSHSWLTDG